jgi:hypothetical protein
MKTFDNQRMDCLELFWLSFSVLLLRWFSKLLTPTCVSSIGSDFFMLLKYFVYQFWLCVHCLLDLLVASNHLVMPICLHNESTNNFRTELDIFGKLEWWNVELIIYWIMQILHMSFVARLYFDGGLWTFFFSQDYRWMICRSVLPRVAEICDTAELIYYRRYCK